MAGCLMQLIAYGAQDLYLTGNYNESSFEFDALKQVLEENDKQLEATNLQKWQSDIKPILAEIRALPPILTTFYGGIEYLNAMEELYSYAQR